MAQLTNFQKAKRLCANLPWCNDDPEDLGRVVQQFVYDQEAYIRKWSQRWFENFQFIFGNTTIKWSRKFDFAVDVDFLKRTTSMSQRAKTNIARTVLEALASLIYSNIPTWETSSANESSHIGKRYSKIAQNLLEAYADRLSMDKEFFNAAAAFVAFGQVGSEVKWNSKSGQEMSIPQWQKVKAPVFTDYMATNQITGGLIEAPVPALDGMGAPYFQDRWEPVIDESGRQVVLKSRAGDIEIDFMTPLEYRREIGSPGIHKSRYVERIKLVDYDKFLKDYEDVGEKTKNFNSIQPFINDSFLYAFAVRHFMRMQFTTPPSISDGGGYQGAQSILKGSLFKHKVLVVEHWDEPNEEVWPKGRRVVVANGVCTNIAEPQFNLDKPGGWHPFSEAQWLSIPPSSIACGPMDSVTDKNRELNVADSLIATALRRNMGSQLLVSIGSGIDPDKMSGEPGQAHSVNNIDGARWLHDEMPIPPVIKMLRDSYKEDIYETSGAQDALRGDRSKGVSSGYAFRQLQEREERRLTPARKSFEYFVSDIGEKLVACLRSNVTKLDKNVVGYLKRRSAGEFNTDDIVSFLTAPMDFGIEIKVEPSSMVAKSKASLQADYLELSKGVAGQRIANDPAVLDEFLKFFGAEGLRDKSASHRDRAKRENDAFSDISRLGPDHEGISPPIVIFEDDDAIHMAEHDDWLVRNSDEVFKNEALLQQIMVHRETHRLQAMEKQGQALPGASLSTSAMINGAKQQPPPGAPQIYQHAYEEAQQKLAKAPAQPRQAGEPNKPTQPTAPSKNTSAEQAPNPNQGGQ